MKDFNKIKEIIEFMKENEILKINFKNGEKLETSDYFYIFNKENKKIIEHDLEIFSKRVAKLYLEE